MGSRVLLIDDGEVDRRFFADTLIHAGFAVETAADGPAGLRALYQVHPDIVLLDIILPGMDGWMVCERIREVSDVAIIMLTSLNREEEMVRGLELGADDFLPKPISPRHLVARVEAVLRRGSVPVEAPADLLYADGELTIDVPGHEVSLGGRRVELTPIEFRLLVALAEVPGRVRTSAELLGSVWGPEYIDDIDFLRVYIWRLRKKLEATDGTPRRILTERGVGYRFAPPATRGRSSDVAAASAPVVPTSGDRRILLVEDDPLNAKLMRDALRASGYATDQVDNGSAALEHVAAQQPDLVVMDIGLPGLDGVETTRRLKAGQATRDIPVVAVTAYAMPADAQRMRAAGCDAFLVKPLRFAEFVETVRALVPPR